MTEDEIKAAASSATMFPNEKARREFIEQSYPNASDDWDKIEKLAIHLEMWADAEVEKTMLDGSCKYNSGFYYGI